ncbi:MAG: universal stress protein [Alphaproteobacteria bacterium]|nr:universal stress protein [Alphaproteobacteria bacterium]
MFKRILLAVDGSEHALLAADVACDLAARYEARLIILSVAKPVGKMSVAARDYIQAEHLAGAPSYLLTDLARAALADVDGRARAKGLTNVKTVVREGNPARRIVEYAKEHDIDLIALGSRGLGDLEGLLLGSVSHKVATLAHCTVITAK